MGLRERVALLVLGLFILQVCYSYCMPKAKKMLQADSLKRRKNRFLPPKTNTQKHSRTENEYESILKTFSFPDIEYTDILFQDIDDFDRNDVDERIDTNIHNSNNKNHLKKSKVNYAKKNKHLKLANKDLVYSSAPIYRDMCKFPEVEYPLHASETWKPIYWNSLINSSPAKQSSYNSEGKNTKSKKRTTKTSDKSIADQLTTKRKIGTDLNILKSESLSGIKNEVLKEYSLPSKDNTLVIPDKNENNPLVTNPHKLEQSYTTFMPNNSLGSTNICSIEDQNQNYVVYDGLNKQIETEPAMTPPTNDVQSTACPYRIEFLLPKSHDSISTRAPIVSPTTEEDFLTSTTMVPMLTCTYNDNTNIHSINGTKVDKIKNASVNFSNKVNITILKEDSINNGLDKNDENVILADMDEEFTTDDPDFDDNSNSMSTISPMTSTTIDFWKQSVVLEPSKMTPSVDELDDYFISV